jgi:hypothetical protein
MHLNMTLAYVGSQGRNLFLRSITNKIVDVRTNADPTKSAIVIRQVAIVQAANTFDAPVRLIALRWIDCRTKP